MQFDLEVPQFLTAELLACVPGLGNDAFKQWVARRTVVLSAGENIGRGRKAVYRGTDVIQVAAIHELIRQGMQTGKATLAWQTVLQGRLISWRTELATHDPPYGRSVFFWINPETDQLVAQQFSEGVDEQEHLDHPDAPDVMILFRIDRFIVRMIERMQRVKAGGPAVAPKARPQPSAFIGWDELEAEGSLETDDQGRKVMIGLTYEETIEWLRAKNLDTYERMGGPSLYASHEEKEAAVEREIELWDKHQMALIRKMATT